MMIGHDRGDSQRRTSPSKIDIPPMRPSCDNVWEFWCCKTIQMDDLYVLPECEAMRQRPFAMYGLKEIDLEGTFVLQPSGLPWV